MKLLCTSLILLLLLTSCSQESSSEYHTLSTEAKDSIVKAKVDSFKLRFSDEFKSVDYKFDKMGRILSNLKEQPLTTTIKMEKIVCGGYSDSCRFDSAYLGNILLKTTLLPDSTSYNQFGYLGDYEALDYYIKQQNMKSSTYKPTTMHLVDYLFPSALEELEQDFYNVKSVWEAKWYLILEVEEYQPPSSNYGGGALKGKWHVFNFREVEYLGSIPISAKNTVDFNPDLMDKTSVTTSKTSLTRLGSGQLLVTTKSITTESSTYHSAEDQFLQAQFDLHKNFKEECKNVLKENCINKEGKSSSIFY